MGTTLTAIQTGNVAWRTVVAIEGYPYLLTDADPPAAAATAWAGTDWSQALGGLVVEWALSQRLHPWEPFSSSSSTVTIKVADDSGADVLGVALAKREGVTATTLAADVNPGDTTITVRDSSAFASSGTLYVGNETIAYGTNAANVFGSLTRGKYSPFEFSGGGGFARTHRTAPTIAGFDFDAGTSTTVAASPLDWRGRWVGIWLHRLVGGVLDVRAEAHLVFAGRIAETAEDAEGRVLIHVDDVRKSIDDTMILREQWKARIADGLFVHRGTRFSASDSRIVSTGGTTAAADDLVVVLAGATPPNEINEGWYRGGEIEAAINAWLAAELAAARLLFAHAFKYADQNEDSEPRSSLAITDAVTAAGTRGWSLTANRIPVRAFFGWGDWLAGSVVDAVEGTAYSDGPPRRATVNLNNLFSTLQVEAVEGSYVDQSTVMNPAWVSGAASGTGIVRIGGAYCLVETPAVTAGAGTIKYIKTVNSDLGEDIPADIAALTPDEDGYITITQVLVLEAAFKALPLILLASTGSGLNWPTYDLLPEHCSGAVPYDLIAGLAAELAAVPGGDDVMTVVVDKPTAFADLFTGDLILRLVQLVWANSRLALRGWATPTSSASTVIALDDRAAPVGTEDTQRAVTAESDEFLRNVIKIRHYATVTGDGFRDTTTIVDPGSASNGTTRAVTIDGRNFLRAPGVAGQDLEALLPTFIAGLPFLTRPMWRVRIPVPFTKFDELGPGTVCLFSDDFARDPATGYRGLTGKPALVIAEHHDWNSGVGEVDLMLFPRLAVAPYSPCAQVDHAAAGGGYDAGTKTLTCEAHAHSAGGDPSDAASFPVGAHVDVLEIDPDTAGAGLIWTNDIVAAQSGDTIQLTTGLAGWDSGKYYRVRPTAYGNATTAQRQKAYQADDADGRVADARDPYGLVFSSTGQVTSWTDSAATEPPAKPPTAAYGDGVALDTGHATDLARGINFLVSYGTAPQQPAQVEVCSYGGAGTWRLVYLEPVMLGVQLTTATLTRLLYVAPTIASATGAAVSVRVTLAQRPPRAADPTLRTRDDVTRLQPYRSTTFNTSSTTYVTASAVGLDISHCGIGPNLQGGIGWLYVELGANALFRGFGGRWLGPLVAP